MKYLLLLFCVNSFQSFAQLMGDIKDATTGQPLSDVEVFINNTSFITSTNEDGIFEFNSLLSSYYDIILYKRGYQIFKSSLFVNNKQNYNLHLTLTPQKEEENISGKESKKEFVLFEKYFSRIVPHKIGNPNDILVTKQEEGWIVTLFKPLELIDSDNGYKVYCYSSAFRVLKDDEIPAFFTRFEPLLPTSPEEEDIWSANKKKQFEGSLSHFFLSILLNKTAEKGYKITDNEGIEIQIDDKITRSKAIGYYKIKLKGVIQAEYSHNGTTRLSKIDTEKELDVNEYGVPFNKANLKISGLFRQKEVFPGLPYDYVLQTSPQIVATSEALLFREHIYVHTDKPYYYQGEPLWFTAYINYSSPDLQPEMSTTLYVEIISPQKKVILSKIYPIQNGTAYGDWILPDTLPSGNYYLRAYTHFNKNFKEELLFSKQLPVLELNQEIKAEDIIPIEEKKIEYIHISTEKKIYKPREKINVTIETKNTGNLPLSSYLSVSVTDSEQVLPIKHETDITEGYLYPSPNNQLGLTQIDYLVEKGILFSGQYTSEKKGRKRQPIGIMNAKTRQVTTAETDNNGIFVTNEFSFYDTASFIVQGLHQKKGENILGEVNIFPKISPAFVKNTPDFTLEPKHTHSKQRTFSEYEVPKDVVILDEITVQRKKIEDITKQKSYGAADHVVPESQIRKDAPNILYSLRQVPGLIVDEINGEIAFTRSQGQSIGFQKEPLITVDDVPVDISILLTIDPNTVEAITTTNRINVRYGAQGAFGVVSIYLKKGIEETSSNKKRAKPVKIIGYNQSRSFKHPDYEDPNTDKSKPDFRSTLYWNPSLKTDSLSGTARFSFFAADLKSKYRIVVEGVTRENTPVKAQYILEVQ